MYNITLCCNSIRIVVEYSLLTDSHFIPAIMDGGCVDLLPCLVSNMHGLKLVDVVILPKRNSLVIVIYSMTLYFVQ